MTTGTQQGYQEPNEVVDDSNVDRCKYCNKMIGWRKSQKSGKPYPVNVHKINGEWKCHKADFHNCRQ